MHDTTKREDAAVGHLADGFDATAHEVTAIDETDMPSSSRSMSLLLDEALAAVEKYAPVEPDGS